MRPEYIREPAVSERVDAELRELISGCFTQPSNAFFRERRYAHEMPLHRYLLRDSRERLVAHVAVHEKRVGVGDVDIIIGGIAEVCVHETQRGRGVARQLLDEAHRGLVLEGINFALLFGEMRLYASSGYQPLAAVIRRLDIATQRFESAPSQLALYKPLSERPWPEGAVDLRGPMF